MDDEHKDQRSDTEKYAEATIKDVYKYLKNTEYQVGLLVVPPGVDVQALQKELLDRNFILPVNRRDILPADNMDFMESPGKVGPDYFKEPIEGRGVAPMGMTLPLPEDEVNLNLIKGLRGFQQTAQMEGSVLPIIVITDKLPRDATRGYIGRTSESGIFDRGQCWVMSNNNGKVETAQYENGGAGRGNESGWYELPKRDPKLDRPWFK
jgi:hypothetical protein